ncbi:MAG: hypothetical protein AB3N14_05385 [Flavobacteriaceae bacterium]
MFYVFWDIENQPRNQTWLELSKITSDVRVIVFKQSHHKEPSDLISEIAPEQYNIVNFKHPKRNRADNLLLNEYRNRIKQRACRPNDIVILISKDKRLINRFKRQSNETKSMFFYSKVGDFDLNKILGMKIESFCVKEKTPVYI